MADLLDSEVQRGTLVTNYNTIKNRIVDVIPLQVSTVLLDATTLHDALTDPDEKANLNAKIVTFKADIQTILDSFQV